MNETTYTPGRYMARIKDYGWCEASTGTPQFFIQLKILSKYDDASGALIECPQLERTFYRAISLKDEKTRQTCGNMLKGDLSAIGVQVEDEAQLDPQHPQAINLFDKEIDVFMTLESYQGSPRERWHLRSAERQKLTLTDLRSRLGGQLFKAGNSTPPPAVPPQVDDTPY
jgi:hypothetical protein